MNGTCEVSSFPSKSTKIERQFYIYDNVCNDEGYANSKVSSLHDDKNSIIVVSMQSDGEYPFLGDQNDCNFIYSPYDCDSSY